LKFRYFGLNQEFSTGGPQAGSNGGWLLKSSELYNKYSRNKVYLDREPRYLVESSS